jgi:hypothetical protein
MLDLVTIAFPGSPRLEAVNDKVDLVMRYIGECLMASR